MPSFSLLLPRPCDVHALAFTTRATPPPPFPFHCGLRVGMLFFTPDADDDSVWSAAKAEVSRLTAVRRQGGPWPHRESTTTLCSDVHMMLTVFIVDNVLEPRAREVAERHEHLHEKTRLSARGLGGGAEIHGNNQVSAQRKVLLQQVMACVPPASFDHLLQLWLSFKNDS